MAVKLPRDSATLLAEHPREAYETWDVNTYMLANLFDLLAAANWQRGGGRSPRPTPLKRPDPPRPPREGFADAADFRSWYAQQPGGRPLNT